MVWPEQGSACIPAAQVTITMRPTPPASTEDITITCHCKCQFYLWLQSVIIYTLFWWDEALREAANDTNGIISGAREVTLLT